MSYIVAGDIKDNVIGNDFTLTDYITETDNFINDLAEIRGVRDTSDIETSPLHWKIKRLAIQYLIMRVCEDNIGVNNVETAQVEKYIIKYDISKRAVKELKSEISISMFTGDVDEIRDRANARTELIFRGG